jgi:hypothetical protein
MTKTARPVYVGQCVRHREAEEGHPQSRSKKSEYPGAKAAEERAVAVVGYGSLAVDLGSLAVGFVPASTDRNWSGQNYAIFGQKQTPYGRTFSTAF